MDGQIPLRQVRAVFDDVSVTVYQAYSPAIADAAVAAGQFVPPFKMGRMTWIKPSFLWMMYRCGWATKPGQERVLAIKLARSGFDEALSRAVLSTYDPDLYPSHEEWRRQVATSQVRVQWDPERTPAGGALRWRSVQIGLRGGIVRAYVKEWTLGIEDITDKVRAWEVPARSDQTILPPERPYPLPPAAAQAIGATP
ncbi:MAG: DUF4291 domain-containing protein [Bifidobacteriaceae bacterium]|jgi:hypothetical protein|nr:DUF4291 domain-containing protein [Bifidobacteriaceae bacterium]